MAHGRFRTLVALLIALVWTVMVAAPAQAANSAGVLSARLLSNGSVEVTATITCDPLAANQTLTTSFSLFQGDGWPARSGEPVPHRYAEANGFVGVVGGIAGTNPVTCDGQAHTYVVPLQLSSKGGPFTPGATSAAFIDSTIWTEVEPNHFVGEIVYQNDSLRVLIRPR